MKELHVNYKVMSQFQDQVEKDCVIPTDIAEVLFIPPMMKLYTSLRQILKGNNILNDEEQPQQNKIDNFLELIVKVQNKLLEKSKESQILQIIDQMESLIKD
jgi:uncharacterized coiled-coil DUF342 family protein